MMNRLFHVLVLSSLPGAAAGCGAASDEEGSDPSGVGGEDSNQSAGGEHSMTGGGHSTGGSQVGGGSSNSGGSDPGAGGSDPETGGTAGASGSGGDHGLGDYQDPSKLSCPSEQWDCLLEGCKDDESDGVWELPSQCRCDDERPVTAQDCEEGQRFACVLVDSSVAPSGDISCFCAAEDLDPSTACRNAFTSKPGITADADASGNCSCAVVLIR